MSYTNHELCKDKNTVLVDVGCGSTPRTAAVFAYRTKWDCYAVDPRLNSKTYRIERLFLHKERIEELHWCFPYKTLVITAVHSHASLENTIKALKAPRTIIIAIPCCVPLELKEYEPKTEFVDWGIWSPHRMVRIYDIVREEHRKICT